MCPLGRAIAQAVSRWLPTAAARVRARVWSSGLCDGQSDAGAGFLRVLRFPLPIHSTKFSILTITRGRYKRPRINGRRAEWTQFGPHHYANLKNVPTLINPDFMIRHWVLVP
jgi:hypothetical protein